jgi:large subunit ribosomal protein L14
MLGKESIVEVADNSGGLIAKIFGTYGGSKRRCVRVGDVVKVAIQKVTPNNPNVKKGDVYKGLIIRTKYPTKTFDGHVARAGTNAIVLLTAGLSPVGTRVFGFASRKAFANKVDSLAKIASLCSDGVY